MTESTILPTSSIPMPPPTLPLRPLNTYKLLSFDVYGTLIEYKSHILTSFKPLLSRLPTSSKYLDPTPLEVSSAVTNPATTGSVEFLKLFQSVEDKIKLETPLPNFDEILAEIYRRIARELGFVSSSTSTSSSSATGSTSSIESEIEIEAKNFGSKSTITSWPTFPHTTSSLQTLSKHYQLIALSNIDAYAWNLTAPSSGLGTIPWTKTFTAEDFVPSSPSIIVDKNDNADEAKLKVMLHHAEHELGIRKDEILHVAQSLGHDHAPAKKLGVASVFLTGDGPRWGKEAESRMAVEKGLVGYAVRCADLREFVGVVEAELKEE